MKRLALLAGALSLALGVFFLPAPLDGASKEIVQLQRDVALLQQQVNTLQQSVERGNAVLKTLIEQSADSVNRMGTTIQGLEESVQTSMGQNGLRVNSLETQVAALRDAIDEMGARFGRVSQQLAETQSVMQSVDARLAASPTTGLPVAGAQPPPAAETPSRDPARTPVPTPTSTPSADALYNAALRDFNSGNLELAVQQFNDYINYYRDTELAGNAQYYLGEIEYQQKKYQSAILQYDKVIEEHPGSYKTAAAYLKKGYALLALDQREEAVTFLRLVVEKFSRWDEANLARSRLQRMGETVPQ